MRKEHLVRVPTWLLASALALPGSLSCSAAHCPPSDETAVISMTYLMTGTVGLRQNLSYYEPGILRLESANGKTYCARPAGSRNGGLIAMIANANVPTRLEEFGGYLRYPGCFIQESLTVQAAGRRKTARVDALEGELLAIVEELEELATSTFGRKYQFSVVRQATEQPCVASDLEVD